MPAVLVSLPTARPAVADDSQERTTLFRPTQKRPTWRDVVRERARSSTPADTRASSQLAPVLRLAPKPDTRGSSKPAAYVPPYLKPGYRWDLLGEALHDAMRAEMGKAAHIRQCPPALAKLLATTEWRGSAVSVPPEARLTAFRARLTMLRDAASHALKSAIKACAKRAAQKELERREARLADVDRAVLLTHPSGATMLFIPS